MEPVALVFLTLFAMVVIGLALLTFREILTDVARALGFDYVKSQVVRAIEQKPRVPDTYQLEPPANHPRTTSSEPVPNRENLIRIAALMTSDDGSYTHSANKIAEFVGGMRTETLAAIRAVRGQSEPTPTDTIQLERRGPRENYVRTGVKPLR